MEYTDRGRSDMARGSRVVEKPMFELIVYPACLDCRWRELEESEVHFAYGVHSVTECSKAPICKLIEGQEQIKAKVVEK